MSFLFNDTFHSGIPHEQILKNITCNTLLMKAQTKYSDDNVLLAAMSEEGATLVNRLIAKSKVVHFNCGHGVHMEKKKEFVKALISFANEV